MLCYGSWPEVQWRYAVDEKEEKDIEIKVPKKIEIEVRGYNSYSHW